MSLDRCTCCMENNWHNTTTKTFKHVAVSILLHQNKQEWKTAWYEFMMELFIRCWCYRSFVAEVLLKKLCLQEIIMVCCFVYKHLVCYQLTAQNIGYTLCWGMDVWETFGWGFQKWQYLHVGEIGCFARNKCHDEIYCDCGYNNASHNAC